MIAIAFRFIAGRYHSTPWGRHVNEGVPEWPPSPLRILRALVAVRYRTLQADTSAWNTAGVLGSLLAKLAAPPLFRLPPATVGHTRHYMPAPQVPLVFDTFVVVGRSDPVVAIWPAVELDEHERSLLRALLGNLSYLGRAESWCQAELWQGEVGPNCVPLSDTGGRGAKAPHGRAGARPGDPQELEPVRVLVPDTRDPELLLKSLMVDVGDLRLRDRRRDPPYSRWETYLRPRGCFASTPLAGLAGGDRGHAESREERVTVARYVLDARPRPPITETLAIAELARRACLALYGRQNGGRTSPILAGKTPDGTPLKGHGHAFYLPTDEDGDGRIDHLTVLARSGFDEPERRALASLELLKTEKAWRGGSGLGPERALHLMLLGLGTEADFRQAPTFRSSSIWRSLTPFVLARHPKVTRAGVAKMSARGWQADGPEDQVWREWEYRRALDARLPSLVKVRRLEACAINGRHIRWLEFRRWRSRGGHSALNVGFGFELTFERAVHGPVSLGYGCHFGLGQFLPVLAEGSP